MKATRRILIIDASRYEGFRLRRRLQLKSPGDVVTIMNQPRAGLDELAQARYDVSIVDLVSLLSYEVNGRKFLMDFTDRSPDSRLVIIDNTADEIVGARFAFELEAMFGPQNAVIINKDDLTHLLVPGIVDKLVPSSLDPSMVRESLTAVRPIVKNSCPIDLPGQLAHEVNNPLMTILGTVELLLAKPEYSGNETGRKLRIIRRSAKRIQSSLVRMGNEINQQSNHQPADNRLSKTVIFSKI